MEVELTMKKPSNDQPNLSVIEIPDLVLGAIKNFRYIVVNQLA